MGTLSNIGNSKTKVVLDVDEFGFFNAATQESVGLMRSMNEKEADIAQVVFSVATNRMPVIDYTLPLVRAQTRFFAKLPDDVKIQWSAYFRVFNSQVWALIGFSLLFFPMLLTLMKNKFEKFIGIHSFFGNFVDMLGVYCQQGLPGMLKTTRKEDLAMSLTKNSPYTETINYNILRLQNHGIMTRLNKAYFYKLHQLPENRPRVVTISEIIPPLAIWIVGVASSWIIFYIEILLLRKCCCDPRPSSHISI